MNNFKILKGLLLTIILIPIIIVGALYIWFLYQASLLDKNTYTCYIKYSKPYNEEKFFVLDKIYKKQRGIPIETSVSEPSIANAITVIDNEVNAQPTTKDFIEEYDKSATSLDSKYFVIDFDNYKSNDKNMILTDEQISGIAEKGFEESSKRIAGEGASNRESETIKTEEVIPNNYFTAKYSEPRKIYRNLKMNAYVVRRENEMGNGIKIYIDPTTGLIVGGEAYGD